MTKIRPVKNRRFIEVKTLAKFWVLLLLVASIGLAGCSSKDADYLQVGQQYIRFELPADWTAQHRSRGHSLSSVQHYQHPKLGSLAITAQPTTDFRSELSGRVNDAAAPRDRLNFGKRIADFAVILEPAKAEPHIAEALTCMARIPKDVSTEQIRQALKDWKLAEDALCLAADDPSAASLLVQVLTKVKLPLTQVPGPVQEVQVGVKAIAIGNQCFLFGCGNLVCIEASSGGIEPAQFESIAKTFQFNAPAPKRSSNRSWGGLSLFHWIMAGVYLVCVAFPSYLGAISGYHSSEDPQQGAKSGAFQATFYGTGFTMAAGIISIIALSLGTSKQSAGLMAVVALVMISVVGIVATAIATLTLATLARFGAGLGARNGARSAGIWAVILPAVAVMLLMFYQSAK